MLLTYLRAANPLVLLLDYDGTLVPFETTPERASPSGDVLALLRDLAATPRYHVHLISGRPPDVLERWLGHLRVGLWAEHGLYGRPVPDSTWKQHADFSRGWLDQIRPILKRFTSTTPGALLREKSASLAWHYRRVAPELAARRTDELRRQLAEALRGLPAEIIEGSKVLEVRPGGVNKGLAVRRILSMEPAHASVLAIGDDRTDEDMFAALPPTAVAIHVGAGTSRAPHHLENIAAVHRFLRRLCVGADGTPAPANGSS